MVFSFVFKLLSPSIIFTWLVLASYKLFRNYLFFVFAQHQKSLESNLLYESLDDGEVAQGASYFSAVYEEIIPCNVYHG